MSAPPWINYEGTMGWGLLPHQGQGLITSEVHAASLLDSSSPLWQQCLTYTAMLATNQTEETVVSSSHIIAFAMPSVELHTVCAESFVAIQSCPGCREAGQPIVL